MGQAKIRVGVGLEDIYVVGNGFDVGLFSLLGDEGGNGGGEYGVEGSGGCARRGL